jgi:acetoin utilization deacetylase AcuC-like enzyme
VRVFYSPRYEIDIGPHVFPTLKYRLVRDTAIARGIVRESDILEPAPLSWDDLARVHTQEYLAKMRGGALTPEDIAQLELPWSENMVDGFRVMAGGTVEAALTACAIGISGLKSDVSNGAAQTSDLRLQASDCAVVCHVGGGLHHAFPNHGEGFCPFNDVAVAVRVLQAHGLERAAIVDLDVHHGNGTAFIFESDLRVFTFSMHQQHNYPMWKPRSSLDIGLADGTGDEGYLEKLRQALPRVIGRDPGCMFYLAGADPFQEDQLGGLRLTKEGLRSRDRLVIEAARDRNIPLVITLAGGYARRVEDTVAIHVATIEEAVTACAT